MSTTLNLDPPPTELDRRENELKSEAKQFAAESDTERPRLKSAKASATARQKRAYATVVGIIGDAMKLGTVPDEELGAAKQELAAAAKAEEDAAAELSAHESRFDLGVWEKALAARQTSLELDRLRERDYARAKRSLLRGLEMEADALEAEQDARRSPEAARMVVCHFPAGLFAPVETAGMGTYRRSVFNDEFLRSVAVTYPDLLDVLAPERKAEVLSRIDPANPSTRYFARVEWSILGDRGLSWNNDLRTRIGERQLIQRRAVRRFHPQAEI
jgi:hypothetical protein